MSNTNNTRIFRWGILGTANIAQGKLIPAIKASSSSEVIAVASRTVAKAEQFAANNHIRLAYGGYEQLLENPDIDIVYIPLPNHLHVPWATKALKAGKHVLCEKPIALDSHETENLISSAAQHPDLIMMEAFMYRFHPQWDKVKELIQIGSIGKVNSVEAVFSYYNSDPNNVRNQSDIGGGGLMDIGCYCISASRFIFDSEPERVISVLDIDENFGTDKHCHGILNFTQGNLGTGQANIYCSTQSEPSQRVYVSGEHGSILIESPFYQIDGLPARVKTYHKQVEEVFEFSDCNQYLNQVNAFTSAIEGKLSTPTPLSDALANMKVIDAIAASHQHNSWIKI